MADTFQLKKASPLAERRKRGPTNGPAVWSKLSSALGGFQGSGLQEGSWTRRESTTHTNHRGLCAWGDQGSSKPAGGRSLLAANASWPEARRIKYLAPVEIVWAKDVHGWPSYLQASINYCIEALHASRTGRMLLRALKSFGGSKWHPSWPGMCKQGLILCNVTSELLVKTASLSQGGHLKPHTLCSP